MKQFVIPSSFARGVLGGDMTMLWRPGLAASAELGETVLLRTANGIDLTVKICNIEPVTFVLTDLIEDRIASVEMDGRPIDQELIHLLALACGFCTGNWPGVTPRQRMGNWLTDAGHRGRVSGWMYEWRPVRTGAATGRAA